MKLQILNTSLPFSCQRTCTPGIECLFGPVLRSLGETRVVSHTTKVNVKMQANAALAAAITQLGGKVLGVGSHVLYGTNRETGLGFTLPGWRYNLILKNDNTLAFDTFLRRDGFGISILQLSEAYTITQATLAAQAEGWATEKLSNGYLMIHHPSGATITVSPDGTVESNGFTGTGCDVASAIENALGQAITRENKSEYYIEETYISQ